MGMTSHLSCFYGAFYFYRVSFSLMTRLTMIGSGFKSFGTFSFPISSENSVDRVSEIFSVGRVSDILKVGRISGRLKVGCVSGRLKVGQIG